MRYKEVTVDLFLPEPRVPRAKGTHVSGIIRAIALETGILKPEWAEDKSMSDSREITDPVAVLRMNIGLAWEEYYIPTFLGPLGVKDHPDAMCVDGVHMSPDGLSTDVIITKHIGQLKGKRTPVIHEVKVTYKSVNTVADLSKEFIWISQIKSYCKGKGTRHAQLHVLFLCGDYKFPITPQLRVWAIEFTQQEIDDNWSLLIDYKEENEERN